MNVNQNKTETDRYNVMVKKNEKWVVTSKEALTSSEAKALEATLDENHRLVRKSGLYSITEAEIVVAIKQFVEMYGKEKKEKKR